MIFTIKLQPYDDVENPLTNQHDVLELIYDQTHEAVRILFALNFEIKATYVGFSKQYNAAAEAVYPVLFKILSNDKNEADNDYGDEINKHNFIVDCLVANGGRVPEISSSFESSDWCYVTFVLGADAKSPTDHELLSLSHHAEIVFYGMVRVNEIDEYVVQCYEKGDYDTGYFICDENDAEEYSKIYYGSNPENSGFRRMQDESFIESIIVPRGGYRAIPKIKQKNPQKKQKNARERNGSENSTSNGVKTDSNSNNAVGGVREKSGAFSYDPLKRR